MLQHQEHQWWLRPCGEALADAGPSVWEGGGQLGNIRENIVFLKKISQILIILGEGALPGWLSLAFASAPPHEVLLDSQQLRTAGAAQGKQ